MRKQKPAEPLHLGLSQIACYCKSGLHYRACHGSEYAYVNGRQSLRGKDRAIKLPEAPLS